MQKITDKHEFAIYDKFFGRKCVLLLNFSPEELGRWKIKNNIQDSNEHNYNLAAYHVVICDSEKQTYSLIWQHHFDWTTKTQGTLVHELTHFVFRIFADNNIPTNLDTQEFFAEILGDLFSQTSSHLYRRTHKRKKT